MDTEKKDHYTLAEAAVLLGVTKRSVRRYMSRLAIKAAVTMDGRAFGESRVSADDLQRLLTEIKGARTAPGWPDGLVSNDAEVLTGPGRDTDQAGGPAAQPRTSPPQDTRAADPGTAQERTTRPQDVTGAASGGAEGRTIVSITPFSLGPRGRGYQLTLSQDKVEEILGNAILKAIDGMERKRPRRFEETRAGRIVVGTLYGMVAVGLFLALILSAQLAGRGAALGV